MSVDKPVATIQAASPKLLSNLTPLWPYASVYLEEDRLLLPCPFVSPERRIQRLTISLGASIVGPTRNLSCNERPLGAVSSIQILQDFVFVRSPRSFLDVWGQRMKPPLHPVCSSLHCFSGIHKPPAPFCRLCSSCLGRTERHSSNCRFRRVSPPPE